MSNKKAVLIICVVILASFVCAADLLLDDNSSTAAGATPSTVDDASAEVSATLPSFRRLNPDYARGSLPNRGGVSVLAKLGVRTIVDLRSIYEHNDDIGEASRRMGINYDWLPMGVWDPPTDEQATRFLEVVTGKSQGPFFVFCGDGLNRTGEMSAIYRVAHDGWDVDQALKEMDEAGFNPYFWSLRQYVWTYARKFKPDAVPPQARALSSSEK